MSTDHRVVKQFRIEWRMMDGRQHIDVTSLGGTLVDQFDGWTKEEALRRLHEAGYQTIPPRTADELDLLNAHHAIPRW
jgi:hypothetical protein